MEKLTLAHVTHEAAGKIGGIGAVLEGFFTSKAYLENVNRTILISPLFNTDGPAEERLGPNSEILYSSCDRITHASYATAFSHIENYFDVDIVYGRRTFVDKRAGVKSSPEVLLIDVTRMDKGPVNHLKRQMFEEFGIRSDLYEHLWEYEQYVRLAPAAIAAMKALGAIKKDTKTIIISHEFMGMPTALAGVLDETHDIKTIFHAHEAATIRRIVENHPGHDTMFYNVMRRAKEDKYYVNDVFGDQHDFFKHSLIEASKYCDNILGVGDYVVDELKFLAPEFAAVDIDLVYNGIPAYEIDLSEKLESKEKLVRYCDNLIGWQPDFIFTHVTRMAPSKGLWRDLMVLEHMDKEFRTMNKTAVMLILSTQAAQRRKRDICKIEAEYKWPVAHREGMPDMSGGEAEFYTQVQEFNTKSRNIKVIMINQFGFCYGLCGRRIPEDMEFMDIRKGSDVEFGQSIYEPFGIAQLEPLSFGGICVVTNVCGCAGFVRTVTGGRDVRNVIIADYTTLDHRNYPDIEDMLNIDESVRKHIEQHLSEKVALEICVRLPKTDEETREMIQSGYELAKNMSWDVVVEDYLLKSLEKAIHKQRYHGAYARSG